MAKHTGKKKKALKAVIITIAAVIVLAAAAAVLAVKYMPSFTQADLDSYYGLFAAYDNELAIILRDLPLSGDADDEERDRLGTVILEERALIEDGTVYVPIDVIKTYIDDRFYYDENDSCVIVTNAEEMVLACEGESSYTINGTESVDAGYVIFITDGDTVYIAMDFADTYSCAYYGIYEDPGRIVIDYISEDTTYCEVLKDTKIRQYGGIKSDIIGEVSEGDILQVKRTLEGWYEVISEDGYVGYVKSSAVSEVYTVEEESDYAEPEYTSLSLGETIKLGWFAVYNTTANENFFDITEDIDINVVSPTWYTLISEDGDIEMLSDESIVNLAHAMGYSVWVMFSDGEYEYVEAVLTSTQKRQKVIDAVMEDILAKGIDGINIDFERILSDYGEDFIEFIRELSIRCRQEGIYLSVDNYAPYDSRYYYYIEEQSTLCDYVIVMEYDDYVGTGEQGPNSSLSFIEEVTDMALEKIDAEKLICALPFYSRFWIEDAEGNLSSNTYFMSTAMYNISTYGAELIWDEELGMYTAEYTNSDGNTVYAYIEDAESIAAKLELLSGYSIAGAAFWRLGMEDDDVWNVIESYGQ